MSGGWGRVMWRDVIELRDARSALRRRRGPPVADCGWQAGAQESMSRRSLEQRPATEAIRLAGIPERQVALSPGSGDTPESRSR